MMIELTENAQLFTGLTAITVVFLISAGILIAKNRTISYEARIAFLVSVIALVFISVADWISATVNGVFPEMRYFHAALMAVSFALAPSIPVFISNAIMPERFFKWVVVVLVVHGVFQLASIFGGFVFWIDDGNVYHRGRFYFVYMIAYTASALYLVVESIRMSRSYQAVGVAAILSILVCLATGVLIQVFNGAIRTTWPAVAMTVVLYFIFYSDTVLRNDALTKLLNRHGYEEFLANPPHPCTVVLIDIDNFKNVNDSYGHAFGDACLEEIAAEIRKTFGSAGLCYRTGGDEFAVVMTKRLPEVAQLADDLTSRIERLRLDDSRLPSVSIGWSAADEHCKDIEAVINVADKAMYQAKGERKRQA